MQDCKTLNAKVQVVAWLSTSTQLVISGVVNVCRCFYVTRDSFFFFFLVCSDRGRREEWMDRWKIPKYFDLFLFDSRARKTEKITAHVSTNCRQMAANSPPPKSNSNSIDSANFNPFIQFNFDSLGYDSIQNQFPILYSVHRCKFQNLLQSAERKEGRFCCLFSFYFQMFQF